MLGSSLLTSWTIFSFMTSYTGRLVHARVVFKIPSATKVRNGLPYYSLAGEALLRPAEEPLLHRTSYRSPLRPLLEIPSATKARNGFLCSSLAGEALLRPAEEPLLPRTSYRSPSHKNNKCEEWTSSSCAPPPPHTHTHELGRAESANDTLK